MSRSLPEVPYLLDFWYSQDEGIIAHWQFSYIATLQAKQQDSIHGLFWKLKAHLRRATWKLSEYHFWERDQQSRTFSLYVWLLHQSHSRNLLEMTLQRLKKKTTHTPFLFVLFSKDPLRVTWADERQGYIGWCRSRCCKARCGSKLQHLNYSLCKCTYPGNSAFLRLHLKLFINSLISSRKSLYGAKHF